MEDLRTSAIDVQVRRSRPERLENRRDQQTPTETKTRLVDQINSCLRSGDYRRALDLLRGTAAEFPNDAELAELEKRAQDCDKRNVEVDRLITESQELFAQRNSAEAIQLLRKAYGLDKNNSVVRAILANALVEHAQSMVETDWLEAEGLTNQALALNPAHPTAKTILNVIVDQKKTSSAEDWVSQARKLQSSGDLFRALAWVAEGLAIHPNDRKLLQIHEAIQRDQGVRRRQGRRRDLENLRRMELEIDAVADIAAKQALVERIEAVAAKHWSDGEILSVANGLLHRLGLIPQESSTTPPHTKAATVIFHVPRHSPQKPSPADANPVSTNQLPTHEVPTSPVSPGALAPNTAPPGKVPPSTIPPRFMPRGKVRAATQKAQLSPPQDAPVPAAETSIAAAKVTSPSSPPEQPRRSNSKTLILVSVSVSLIILVSAVFFSARNHRAPSVAKTPAAAQTAATPEVSAPAVSAPVPSVSAPQPITAEPSLPALQPPSVTAAGKATPSDHSPADSSYNMGTLVVVAGQDDAKVFLNGKLQRQLTQAGQLRLPNLELKDYVVQVSKSGYQDPPQQKIRIRKGEEGRLIFNLQPQPRLASLTIQGGAPGAAVLVDQTPVGTIQPDGTLSVSTVNPGDHTIELRKDRFKPRQFKKHFVAGGTISLAATDAVLGADSGELKITFAPADASVAIVKGDLLKVVSSGVPLNVPAGTYTLTARTADRFTRSSTLEVIAGESKILDLSLAPSGMSKWDDPSSWKHEGESFIRKGGDFVLYGVVPASGTFVLSAMITKGHLLQWVLNYTDPKNYVLFQMDDNNFYRSVIHNGQKANQIVVPHKGNKKSFRTLHIRVSPTELVHQIKNGDSSTVLDRWTQPGTNLSIGKFGFYIPGNDQVTLSSFAHYADLNVR